MAKRAAYTLHNDVSILRGGSDYFNAIDEIAARATYSLHLQTYIFDADETGQRVADALMNAARRGVMVYLLVDGYASQKIPKQFIEKIRSAGVRFRFFQPFLKSKGFYFGRRMHHKIVVADGRWCLVGGLNISNRYNDWNGTPAWLDWALMVEGEVGMQLDKVCRRMWNRNVLRKKCVADRLPSFEPPASKHHVRIRRNDWVYNKTEITAGYRAMFVEAQREITIMTSYFWPPAGLLKRMEVAARRGVHIRLVLTGTADVPFAKYTERYLYSRLFRSNVEIYEYSKNVLHGKTAMRDGEWMTLGSYNLNSISAFASVELNLDVADEGLAGEMTAHIDKIIKEDSVRVMAEDYRIERSPLKMFYYYVSFRTVQLLFFLFTFYYSQKKRYGS
ncbi:MAG: phospholipase [Taibaiella sp.]|nr:phospholipase [Taibaiella sp.]